MSKCVSVSFFSCFAHSVNEFSFPLFSSPTYQPSWCIATTLEITSPAFVVVSLTQTFFLLKKLKQFEPLRMRIWLHSLQLLKCNKGAGPDIATVSYVHPVTSSFCRTGLWSSFFFCFPCWSLSCERCCVYMCKCVCVCICIFRCWTVGTGDSFHHTRYTTYSVWFNFQLIALQKDVGRLFSQKDLSVFIKKKMIW